MRTPAVTCAGWVSCSFFRARTGIAITTHAPPGAVGTDLEATGRRLCRHLYARKGQVWSATCGIPSTWVRSDDYGVSKSCILQRQGQAQVRQRTPAVSGRKARCSYMRSNMRDQVYRIYLDFLETAENKRHWNIFQRSSPGTSWIATKRLTASDNAWRSFAPKNSTSRTTVPGDLTLSRSMFGMAWFQTSLGL